MLRTLGATCCRDSATSSRARSRPEGVDGRVCFPKRPDSAGAGGKLYERRWRRGSPLARQVAAEERLRSLTGRVRAIGERSDAAFAAVGSENLLQRIAEDDESRRGSSQAIAKLPSRAYFPLRTGRDRRPAAALYNKKPLAAPGVLPEDLAELAPAEDVARCVARGVPCAPSSCIVFEAVFGVPSRGRGGGSAMAVAAMAPVA